MDIEIIGKKLENIMNNMNVVEGLILAKINGEILIGQTLTEMKHSEIAKKVGIMFETKIEALQKGNLTEITLGMDEGHLIAVKHEDIMVLGILGTDGKSSIGLLTRQLKNLMK